MQKLIISCKTNDEIKYEVCAEEGLKLNNNALELELTNEELNILINELIDFRDEINGLNPHCYHVNFPNNGISKEEVKDYIVKLIDGIHNELEINKILKNKTLKRLEEENKIINDKLEKTKAFLNILEKQLF